MTEKVLNLGVPGQIANPNWKEVISMNEESRNNLKDMLWGFWVAFWVGMIVIPAVRAILHLERDEKNNDKAG